MSYEIFKGLSHVGIPENSKKIVTFLQVICSIKRTYEGYLLHLPSNIYIPKLSPKSNKSKFTEMCNNGQIAVCARDDKFGKLFLELVRVVIDNDYDRVELYKNKISKKVEDRSLKYPNCPEYFGNYQYKTLFNVIQSLWSGSKSGNGDGYIDFKLDEKFPTYLHQNFKNNNILILNIDCIFEMFIEEFKKRVQIKYIDNDELINSCFKQENIKKDVEDNERDVIDIITSSITSLLGTIYQVIIPSSV